MDPPSPPRHAETDTPTTDLALRRVKVRSYLTSGLVMSLSSPLSLLVDGEGGPVLAGVLLGFGVVFFGLALLLRSTRVSLQRVVLGAVFFAALLLALAAVRLGGVGSPSFAFLVFLPLLVAVGSPDNRPAVASAVGLSLVLSSVINLLAGGPDEVWLRWLSLGLVVGLFALHGTRQYRQMFAAQRAADAARLEAQEQLAQSELRRAASERLALAGQLAAGVAHEINNPLSFATSNVRYVLAELKEEEGGDLREAMKDAVMGLDRIAQIVRDLRASTRTDEPMGEERCVLGEALQEALRVAGLRLNPIADVKVDLPEEVPPVRFHTRHLVQVLVNLLVNAADAVEETGRRGTVTVRVFSLNPSGRLCIEVDDDGPGIPPHVLPRVFDPFFTTKPVGKGTGLGLPLGREYARRYGGELKAGNRPEGGARMSLELLPA